jgi:hypothetical protein
MLVKSLVEEDCLIVTETKAQEILAPHTLNNSSLCLVNGQVASDTACFLERCGITRILGTKGIWWNIPGWSHATWTGDHTQLGDVTTSSISGLCLALGAATPRAIERPDGIGRDASTVLSIKAPARHYRSAPPNCMVEPLGCVDVGTPRLPCFHGGGLLPGNCDRKTLVLSPGLYAPKGKWARRNMTVEEVLVLIAKDCGRVSLQLLGTARIRNELLRNIIAGKCLVAL